VKKILINEREADIGDFTVGRLLPVREKRQVGPVTFLDHMGPAEIGNGKYLDVDQHPHIGLSTLTYLFEGEIEHKDSLGTVQLVGPGDVGFMTAAKGITHTERTPKRLRNELPANIHGYQIWIALPLDKEEIAPVFDFVPNEKLPHRKENDLRITVIAGKAFGMESPVKVYSPVFIVDVLAEKEVTLNLTGQLEGEMAFTVVKGVAKMGDDVVQKREMLIVDQTDNNSIHLESGSRILMLGGKPFPDKRFLLWNFVSSRKARLQQAKSDWQAKRFPKVPGDDTYVPFP